MNEGKPAIATSRARPEDVRADYEELRVLVDRLHAIVRHQNMECERILNLDQPAWPNMALVIRISHELVEQCLAELNVVRQRMGLRIESVTSAVSAQEARRPIMI